MSTDHLERQQLGMSVAGSHQLVHAIRMTVEADPEEVFEDGLPQRAHLGVPAGSGGLFAGGPHPSAPRLAPCLRAGLGHGPGLWSRP